MADAGAPAKIDPEVYRTLLESTRAIPWKIDWGSGQFAYIGPQIESLLGWTPESWRTVQDWAERIHPDDRSGWCPSAWRSRRPVPTTRRTTAR